jgi:thiamine-monophosphate kinase
VKPFSDKSAETVAALGESALLRAIRGWLGPVTSPSPRGMGDDCAVLDPTGASSTLATTDGVVYGRHFDNSAAPTAVGAKLLKRNISDIAAMGGKPGPTLLNLLLARNTATVWIEQFYRGLAETCEKYGVMLVGGDLAQGPDNFLAAHLTLLGTPGAALLTRTGAKIGDALFVTGDLGGSILGKHLDFTPRLAEGQWLARQGGAFGAVNLTFLGKRRQAVLSTRPSGVRGVIDVTDGLAKDLPEILPAGADARLDVASLPIAKAAHTLAAKDGRSALAHALTDGEDYELLFAVDGKSDLKKIAGEWQKTFTTPLTRIGVIAAAQDPAHDRQLRDEKTGGPLLASGEHGYEHFH